MCGQAQRARALQHSMGICQSRSATCATVHDISKDGRANCAPLFMSLRKKLLNFAFDGGLGWGLQTECLLDTIVYLFDTTATAYGCHLPSLGVLPGNPSFLLPLVCNVWSQPLPLHCCLAVQASHGAAGARSSLCLPGGTPAGYRAPAPPNQTKPNLLAAKLI